MPDALAFAGVIQSLKAATEIGKALVGIRDSIVIAEKISELNGEILSAQASALAAQADQFALLERVRGLEKQIADLEAWEAQKQKYKLTQIRPGVYAYTPKESTDTYEPPHMLCTNCYEQGHKSILQEEVRFPGRCHAMVCPRCGTDIYTEGEWQPDHSGRKRRSK